VAKELQAKIRRVKMNKIGKWLRGPAKISGFPRWLIILGLLTLSAAAIYRFAPLAGDIAWIVFGIAITGVLAILIAASK